MRLAIYCLVFLIVSGSLVNGAEDPLQNRCQNDIQKVVACLNFATGTAATPSKECCDSASSIDEKDRAVCFCYIIEQVHSGGNDSQIKNSGIQEGRLLQLPSACKINDVNVTSCPKVLNLPANSPDAAFFTNANASASTSTTPVVAAGPSASNAFKHTPLLSGHLPVAVAIFCFTFWKMF